MEGFPRSREYLDRARAVLAGGVTSSIRLAEKPHPLFFARARGAVLEDVDGREYLDYVCGYGPVILGHADPRVTEAVARSLPDGQAFGGQHLREIEVAERIRNLVPSMEVMRFSSSGSEAVHAAIRIARAVTGRRIVVRFDGHYHGWLDGILAANLGDSEPPPAPAHPGSRGQLPEAIADVTVLAWNDGAGLAAAADQLRGRLACVILEPILCNTGVISPRPGFVEAIHEWCRREGAVLIFDEVITGFRVASGGAQALLGIKPDLSVFGKAMANGFPVSAVGGRRDLLSAVAAGEVLHAGTFNGQVASMAAARATLDALAADSGAVYRALTATGRALMHGLRAAAAEAGVPVLVQGPGPVFHLWFTNQTAVEDARTARATGAAEYARFARTMLDRGVRLIPGGRWYVNAAHSPEHVARTLNAAQEAFREIATSVAS